MKKLLVGLCFLYAMIAQTATVTLESQIGSLNQISLNDLDITGKGVTLELFKVAIAINGANGKNVSATFKVDILRDNEILFTVTSQTIHNVKDNSASWSNATLNKSLEWPTEAGNVILKFKGEANKDSDFKPSLSSSLPDGEYDVTVSVVLSKGQGDSKTFQLGNIINNTRVDLISPANDEVVNTAYPTFSWLPAQSMASFPEATFYLYKVVGGNIRASMSKKAILEEKFTYSPTTSFQFPAANDRQLEDGATYVWTLKVGIKTLSSKSGFSQIDNSFNVFKYSSGQASAGGASDEIVENALKILFGANYEKVKNDFNGYNLKEIFLNGNKVDFLALQQYLDDISSGKKRVVVEY